MMRDYNQEMHDRVAAAIPDGDFVSANLSQDIVRQINADDPDLMAGWLKQREETMVTRLITSIRRDRRNRLRRVEAASPFAKAASVFGKTGDKTALQSFLDQTTYKINERTIRRLGDMTSDDCIAASNSYRRAANANGLEAAWLRVLAEQTRKRGGDDAKVRDVFNDDDLKKMHENIRRSFNAPPIANGAA